ncbi:hypothetical protein [Deinococcus yunweiensis]|uniref:hypothetical protein n=1 Tax=Deinococcus yunweiensis TaxID=367282 RepID=UPI00398EC601
MTALRITHVEHQRRTPRPFIDLAGFFLFFGISGVDHGREARMQRRFEQETFTHHVTVQVVPPLPPGRYLLDGLPHDVGGRPWVVSRAGQAVAALSDDGWTAFQTWQQGGRRELRAVPLAEV